MATKISFLVTDSDHNMKTDVISQPINEKLPDGTYYLGEVLINEKQVERQAKEYRVSKEEEMARVVAHGVLHLLGYKDELEEERRKMKAIEDAVVRRLDG